MDPATVFAMSVQREEKAKSDFNRFGFALLPGFTTAGGLQFFLEEFARLETLAIRRDLAMPTSGHTERKMRVINGRHIAKHSPLLCELFEHPELNGFLSRIAGEPIYLMNDPVEYAVINILERTGDRHGAHRDQFPYAFTVYMEVPQPQFGGILQLTAADSHTLAPNADQKVEVVVSRGDCIFMKSSDITHGVSQLLLGATRRCVLNVAYVNQATKNVRSDSNILYEP